MPSLPLFRLFTSLRSIDREELMLQGAFLVGLTSLVLLVGQSTRMDVKETRPVKQPMEAPPPPPEPLA